MLAGARSRAAQFSTIAKRRPRLTAGLTAGFMGGCGDLGAQHIERSSNRAAEDRAQQPICFRRAFAMSTFCATCASVVYVPFYTMLDRYFGVGRGFVQVVQKVG
eukprot:SAG31_NODE_1422_length_8420_cov_2.887514_7_plen_104_part_00